MHHRVLYGATKTDEEGMGVKVAVLFERSGVIRDAFLEKGHEAISCDLEPTGEVAA